MLYMTSGRLGEFQNVTRQVFRPALLEILTLDVQYSGD